MFHITLLKSAEIALSTRYVFSKTLTRLDYYHNVPFTNENKHQNVWTSELGVTNIDIPTLTTKNEQRFRGKTRTANDDSSHRLLVTSAHCAIGTEKKHEAGMKIEYTNDNYPKLMEKFYLYSDI